MVDTLGELRRRRLCFYQIYYIIASVLKTRAAIAPLEQRAALQNQTAGPADMCPSGETVDGLLGSLPLEGTVTESVLHRLIKEYIS